MKKILLVITLFSTITFAQINVATTYNYLGEVTKAIGGDLVKVDVLSNPKLDPHFITPKPSLIAKLRREDLLIINGGGLEIGWLPSLLKRANNSKINNGARGFLDVSGAVTMIDKPATVSRAYGDVHPDGNPHYALDINNISSIAELIGMKLSQIDPINSSKYSANFVKFKNNIEKLKAKLTPITKECKGKKIIQYHELFNYALNSFGVEKVGDIEPLAGISPSSRHTLELINIIKTQKIDTILQDVYHEKRTATFIANKTGANVKIVPHDVGATKTADSLEAFYTEVATKICQ